MTIRELKERIRSWHSDEMDFCIEDVFSWRGSYDEPCCALSNRTTTKFESDYGSYTSGEYLIKFICANPTPIIEHIFG